MRHTCEHCQSAYEIPDEKVAGRFLKVRCKRCQATMHVVGLRPPDATGHDDAAWWCAIANEPRGPYREDEVKALVAAGDVHARTRMWASGMPGWQRVAESAALAWVYNHVIDRAAQDPSLLRMPSCVFDRAALLSDGNGYFPDPTLKSGIILLDETMQKSLERLAQQQRIPGATGTHAWPSLAAPFAAAFVGAAAAATGFVWFVASAS
jgi:predicted Zn finger-like uncharacterized protein